MCMHKYMHIYERRNPPNLTLTFKERGTINERASHNQ